LKGYERAAHTIAWLGDAGLNAETHLNTEADRARTMGEKTGGVDLITFVRDAVLLHKGLCQEAEPGVIRLTLPPAWIHGLDGLPGFDPADRTLLLTTDMDKDRDRGGDPLATWAARTRWSIAPWSRCGAFPMDRDRSP